MIKEIGDLKVDNEIKSLGDSLAKYAKSKPILTDEQTNLLVRQKFAEKWVANESHWYQHCIALFCEITLTFDKKASKSPFFELLK